MDKTIIIAGAVFFGIMLYGTAGFAPENGGDTAEAKASPAPSPPTANLASARSSGQFTTVRAPDGHFYADARINGRSVRMLIDTGASSVVLSRSDAQRIGISLDPTRFTEQANTAGGVIAIMPVTLNEMSVGSLREHNVPAFVAESDLGISLVGQSFLQRIDSVEIASDQIRLR